MSAMSSGACKADKQTDPAAEQKLPSGDPWNGDVFAKLARWYDLLHSGKDYDADARLYARWLKAKLGDTVVEWGCGTGEFTRRFAGFGWRMFGVDACEEMLALADKKEVPTWAFVPTFLRTSLGVYDLKTFDAEEIIKLNNIPPHAHACAPFAVLSYAGIRNVDLVKSLNNIRNRLGKGGRFAFDVLHAAGCAFALRDHETKQAENDQHAIEECRRKRFFPIDCTLLIEAETTVIEKATGAIADKFAAKHVMRAFSPPELRLALQQCGFDVLEIFNPWNGRMADEGSQLGCDDFNLFVVAEAV